MLDVYFENQVNVPVVFFVNMVPLLINPGDTAGPFAYQAMPHVTANVGSSEMGPRLIPTVGHTSTTGTPAVKFVQCLSSCFDKCGCPAVTS